MKFSESTVNVLKAFSIINKSIELRPGQTISTVSPQKSIMAKAEIDDTIQSAGCFYDLNRFLSVLTLFEEPTFTFQEKYVNIRDKKNSVNYTFSDPSQIITPPEKEIQLPSVDVTCNVKWEDINNAMKAAIVLGLPEIAFKSDGATIELAAIDTKNPTADVFDVRVGSNDSAKVFKAIFKIETLKLMNRDYKVEISSKGIAKFTSTNEHGPKLTYWVAMEEKSSFDN